jgi:hypothetical protein
MFYNLMGSNGRQNKIVQTGITIVRKHTFTQY